jgi:hypothetical protein
LQSYYECFLQIEKENDSLKLKIEQMREKLTQQQTKLDGLLEQQNKHEDTNSTPATTSATTEIEIKVLDNTHVNIISMQHMHAELNDVNKSVELFIEDKRMIIDANTKESKKQDESTETEIVINEEQQMHDYKKRVDELELEKEALNKKLNSIEASLARWIFRACDYKSDLSTSNERCAKLEKEIGNLKENLNRVEVEHSNKLEELQKEHSIHLNERVKENQTSIGALEDKLRSDYESIIDKLNNEWKLKSDENINELIKLRVECDEKEKSCIRLREKLHLIESRKYSDVNTQTLAEEPKSVGHVQVQTSQIETSVSTSAVVQASSKPNAIVARKPQIGSMIAAQAAKLQQQLSFAAQVTNDEKQAVVSTQTANVHQTQAAQNELRLRIDQLLLEKNALKGKNDELKSDLDKLSKELSELKLGIQQQKHQQPQIQAHSQQPHSVATSVSIRFSNKQTQTELKPLSSVWSTATSTSTLTNSNDQQQQLINSLRIKIDIYKSELEQLQLKYNRDQLEYNKRLQEVSKKHAEEMRQAEQALRAERAKLLEQNEENERLGEKIKQLEHEIESIKNKYGSNMGDIQATFKKEKQISDTIIMQQKKLLDYLQQKIHEGGGGALLPIDSYNHPQQSSNQGNHLITNIFGKWKSSNSNPLTANLPKPGSATMSKSKHVQSKTPKNAFTLKEMQDELNTSYMAYTNMKKVQNELAPSPSATNTSAAAPSTSISKTLETANSTKNDLKRQIHVFITGLNTCPTYCHVCQHLIPLIAYASKCQLCSFTCHSTCSSSLSSSNNVNKTEHIDIDPLKYCKSYNYNQIPFENYRYIKKLSTLSTSEARNSAQQLLSDYLFIYVDNSWKKIWVVLRTNGLMEFYQTNANLKPFDTINLCTDRIQLETSYKRIRQLLSVMSNVTTTYPSTAHVVDLTVANSKNINSDEIYECLETNSTNSSSKLKLDMSSLIMLLYGPKLCLQLGFNTFNKKNVWYDALQSIMLLSLSPLSLHISSTSTINKKSASILSNEAFRLFNMQQVLKPFLEFSDTVVNSYCFISDTLIALACDDGLYALNSSSGSPTESAISLVKVETIELAHKLYCQSELGKLCLVGRKSRQFLCIDLNELLFAIEEATNNKRQRDAAIETPAANGDEEDDTCSISVKIDRIQNIDRCHLFETSFINGVWYLAAATPEAIYVLLYNKHSGNFSLVREISTNEAPCSCLKFTSKLTSSKLVYACKVFYKMDMTYLQSAPLLDDAMINSITSWHKKSYSDSEMNTLVPLNDEKSDLNSQQPIAVCVINSASIEQEAVLLCYEEFGVFVTYNSNTTQWQLPNIKKQSSTSISGSSSGSLANAGTAFLRWPRGAFTGSSVPPLQIEYDSPYLYLFYSDSIIVYSISFSNDSVSPLSSGMPLVRKVGVAFAYKPRYLSVLHTRDVNCLIISIRKPSVEYDSSSDGAHRDLYRVNEADEENDDEQDQDNSARLIANDLTDKICLSYFSPN